MSNRNCFYVAAIKSVCVVKTGSLDMTGSLGDGVARHDWIPGRFDWRFLRPGTYNIPGKFHSFTDYGG